MQRVVVIGGGAAGVLAALAARRAGAAVTVIRRSPGASAVSSGAFDFAHLDDHEGLPLPVLEAARAVARREPHHPYARVGAGLVPALIESRALLERELTSLGVRGAEDPARNLLLATPFGTTRRAALAQGAIARGDLENVPRDAVVGVFSIRDTAVFDSELVAAGLRREGWERATALPLSLPLDPFTSLSELARMLDEPASRGPFIGKALAAAQARKATHVLLPTAGYSDPEGLCEALVRGGLTMAAELPATPPSVPGLRLQRALDRRLAEADGVRVIDGEVAASRIVEGRVRAVEIGGGQDVVEGDAFVLASGRFLSGGIRHEERFVEPVFDLPVLIGGEDVADRWVGDLLDRRPAAVQPAFRAGVRVDAHMQPVDEHDRRVLSNVFAAGSVVGGYDSATDGGLGVAALTACVAGTRAARLPEAGPVVKEGAHG